MGRYVAIVNPAAGGGKCGKRAPEALDRLRAAGLEVEPIETHAAGDGTKIVREKWAEGVRDFIAVGGDGTSFEVVNGLFPAALDSRASLGFLPLGTGNSFLRDFTTEGAEHSIRALTTGQKRPCDVIRVEHRDGVLHYINLFSIGFVADVGAVTNRRFKPFGEAGYIFGVVTKVATLHHWQFKMRVDGGALDDGATTFVSINNSRFTGGKMMMAPDADTGDGYADLIRVGPLGRVALLRTFPKIFKGTHVAHPAVTTTRVRHIDFELQDDVDVMVDGEVIRLLPHRLDVLASAFDVRA